jgi:dethiobiotin synthetase
VNRDLFVTGTDTDVGKTLLSSTLVAALQRKYWKPIQTGSSQGTDRERVMRWAGVGAGETFPESYIFDPPVSPHLAAEKQGTVIELHHLQRPSWHGPLIIEGAGGLLVPINGEAFMADVIAHLGAPVIIAVRTALGTINHTLLTIAAARNASLTLRGVVMIGKPNADNYRAIERYGHVPVIGSIPWLAKIDRETLVSVFQEHFDRSAFE